MRYSENHQGPWLTSSGTGAALTLADTGVKRQERVIESLAMSLGHPLPSCFGLLAGVNPGPPVN